MSKKSQKISDAKDVSSDPSTDLNLVEEGRKDGKEAFSSDRVSETEATMDDPSRPQPSTNRTQSRKTTQLLVVFVCITLFLGGIGALLGVLLPKYLNGGDDEVTSSSYSENDSPSAVPVDDKNTTSIMNITGSYNYTSLDPPDDRNGGFYADSRAEALYDGYTDVLEGGKILAWKQSLQQQDSVHRVAFDMEVPQAISEVAIYGIVLERWGLNAPVSIQLQLFDSEGSSFYDGILFTSVEGEGEWVETFMTSVIEKNKGRLVTKVFLDVTCPRTEERIETLNRNMRCGISEVDFL